MKELTLGDLVQNRTMSPEMAATLATAAEERRSLLAVAIPRMAGKSTTLNAFLRCIPRGTPIHQLTRDAGPGLGIPAKPDGGFLVMSEIADIGFPEYLWGSEVRLAFEAVASGFSLATALPAGGLEEAFEVITGANGVPDEHAACIDLMVYIRSLGHWNAPTRRAVAAMYEIESVVGGRPRARLLHRWLEDSDRFEAVELPSRIGTEARTLERHLQEFASVVAPA
jgi:type IV secretory pathway ATPase VirB11/archaellum biosynthesis ATPase